MATRYQTGTLRTRKRKNGPDVWEFRWYEGGQPKSVILGSVKDLPTKAAAQRVVETHRVRINEDNLQQQFHTVTVNTLADRFEIEYIPKHCRKLTGDTYRSVLKSHIRPKWGEAKLRKVKTVAVEDWLSSYDASTPTKGHIREIMHLIFQAALRWEMVDKNPIDLVRQSKKRIKEITVLTITEFWSLMAELKGFYKTMVLTAVCLGLRTCELLSLRWGDVNFEALTIHVQRSVSEGEINGTKTVASEDILDMDPGLAEALLMHKRRSKYIEDSDYIFANRDGETRWPDTIRRKVLHPAAKRAGISKKVGWHTFRYTYSSLLAFLKTNLIVQKELLRHADIQTTMRYTRTFGDEKKEAQLKVANLLKEGQTS